MQGSLVVDLPQGQSLSKESGQGGQVPGWQMRSQEWYPHDSRDPHGVPHLNTGEEQGLGCLVFWHSHDWTLVLEQG